MVSGVYVVPLIGLIVALAVTSWIERRDIKREREADSNEPDSTDEG